MKENLTKLCGGRIKMVQVESGQFLNTSYN